MAIYVDNIHRYPTAIVNKAAKRNGYEWCHMMTDSDDIEELHRFAKKIGMKREWFQDHESSPHYDLVPTMRKLACQHGAEQVTAFEMAKRCSKRFKNREKA